MWLYFRFALSYREVEELLPTAGWSRTRRCGSGARSSGRSTPTVCVAAGPPGDKWHLDEVFIRINGMMHYLWRAVDQHGNVLDILVQSRRDTAAAKKFFRRLLTGQGYVPRVLVTEKLASYRPAHRVVMPTVEHRQSRGSTTGPRIRISRPGNASGR